MLETQELSNRKLMLFEVEVKFEESHCHLSGVVASVTARR
jgi:hypothetical protein